MRDRGLKDVLLSSDQGRARITAARERLQPLGRELLAHAHDAGLLRRDIGHQDMPLIQFMLGSVIDAARDVEPELWRRYFALVLRGLRAEPTPVQPLPVGPLNEEQFNDVMRCWAPAPRR
jgi:hypothetical protein